MTFNAKLDLKDKYNKTPLDYSIRHAKHNISRLLIQNKEANLILKLDDFIYTYFLIRHAIDLDDADLMKSLFQNKNIFY